MLLALSAATGLTACGSGATAPAAPAPRSDLSSIFQDDPLLRADPAGFLKTVRSLGVAVVRANVPWNTIAPDASSPARPAFNADDPAAYPAGAWATYDRIVRAAAAAGVRLYFTLTGPAPVWAQGAGIPAGHSPQIGNWRPSAADFGAFVHAIGERYDGKYRPAPGAAALPRVRWWSIWNEPNYGPNLAPQAIDGNTVEASPALYRALLDAAWSALLHTGHSPSTDTILIGETAPRGQTGPNHPGNFSGMVPLRFIRALYCVAAQPGADHGLQPLHGQSAALRGCPTTQAGSATFKAQNPALFEASGWADHPYPDAFAPNVVTPFDASSEPDYADFAVIGRLARTLDGLLGAYGSDTQLPIYSTEYGYRTNPPSVLGVSPDLAARYLNQSEYLTWRNRRLRSYDQYQLIDPAPSSGSEFVTGLRFADWQPKPAVYDAFRIPLYMPVMTAAAGQPLEVWGCARPAPDVFRSTDAVQNVEIQFAPSGRSFRTLRSVALAARDGCYFDAEVAFPGAGSVRLAWRSPDGWEYSRIQALAAS